MAAMIPYVQNVHASFPVMGPAQSTQRYEQVRPAYAAIAFSPSPQFILKGQIAPGWELVQPLLIMLTRDEDGGVTVFSLELNLYGIGETVEEAINDFISMLIDLYEELNASEAVLSTHLVQRLRELRNVITVL